VTIDKATFEAEADRLVAAARDAGVTLRLIGALAFQRRCPRFGHLQETLGRRYTDIDLAGYGRDMPRIRKLFSSLGYREDSGVYVESEGSRLVFNHPQTRLHVDVFLDKLEFSHTISWNGRLEVDDETVPLAEMLLGKMQIVKINEKDIIDTIMLLLEHPLGASDGDTINIDHIAGLTARDWGLWRTVTMNLGKVSDMAKRYEQLAGEDQLVVRTRVDEALERIEAEPKSRRWRLRARVGDRVKWYREVDELGPMVHERG
jgi:hypothetical protein